MEGKGESASRRRKGDICEGRDLLQIGKVVRQGGKQGQGVE